MSEKLLTIGMATYDDYDGVYFSIQALRLYQLAGIENDVEIIVIDNNPEGKHGKEVKKFVEGWAKGKYIPCNERQSSFVKYDIFKYASGKYTLGIDCHVLFQQNAIKNLLEYFSKNPDSKDLIQGPILYDDLKNISTHFEPVWRGNMHGIWATNKEALVRDEPFEIPMMGMGAYSCRTKAWPEINKNFIGFGGEEGYIHEKFRLAGGKCICLPNFKWLHRFGRPNGVPFKNTIEDRIRNYLLGWYEIYRDDTHPSIVEMHDYFCNQYPNINFEKIKKDIKLLF
jgi:hypothetical protein